MKSKEQLFWEFPGKREFSESGNRLFDKAPSWMQQRADLVWLYLSR